MFAFVSALRPISTRGLLAGVSAVLAGVVLSASAAAQQSPVDPDLPEYRPASGVSGAIKSVGSDTLNNLMTLWAEEFNRFYPNVAVEIEGKGSSTAPPALIEGVAQLGPMSRPMRGTEIDSFQARFGYEPTLLRAGVDALAVFVHKDNPVERLTTEQLRQIFSVDGPDMTWGDVGVNDPEFRNRPISLFGRNSASGTYGFFKEVALGNADFKASVKEQPGSSSVVQGVASDRFAMGYSGIGYGTADVKPVPLALDDDLEAFGPTRDHAYSGDYPLARFLLVYANIRPGQEPTPIVREFIRLMFSRQGQEEVVKVGYFPVTNQIVQEELVKSNIRN